MNIPKTDLRPTVSANANHKRTHFVHGTRTPSCGSESRKDHAPVRHFVHDFTCAAGWVHQADSSFRWVSFEPAASPTTFKGASKKIAKSIQLLAAAQPVSKQGSLRLDAAPTDQSPASVWVAYKHQIVPPVIYGRCAYCLWGLTYGRWQSFLLFGSQRVLQGHSTERNQEKCPRR